MASIENVTTDERLGEIALDLLLDKSNSQKMLITNRARWLKTTLAGNATYSQKHIEAELYLKDIASRYNNKIYKGYNAKVILLRDPTSKDAANVESIKLLLRSGADVRYLRQPDINYRIVITENKLFFSFCDSDNEEHVVNRGFYYVGSRAAGAQNMLIEYYKHEFERMFIKAVALRVSEGGEIIFKDNLFLRINKARRDITIKDSLLLIGGAVLGAVLGVIASALVTLHH
jgi:hypothetical protein